MQTLPPLPSGYSFADDATSTPDTSATPPLPKGYSFADEPSGGPAASPYAKPGSYTTKLSPQDETSFQGWVKQNKIPYEDSPTADYDMRGYWKSGGSQAPNGHFPDTFKTPYHATFSNESKYATKDAPRWVGNRLVDKDGNTVADETPADALPAGATGPLPGLPAHPAVDMQEPAPLLGVNVPKGAQQQLELGLQGSYERNPGPVVTVGKRAAQAVGDVASGVKNVFTPTEAEIRERQTPSLPMTPEEKTVANRQATKGLAQVIAGGSTGVIAATAPELMELGIAAQGGDIAAQAAIIKMLAAAEGGNIASAGAGAAADKLQLSPETKELLQTAAFFLPTLAGTVAARAGVKGGIGVDAQGNPGVAAQSPGGGVTAGVRGTPESFQAGVRVGDKGFEVNIPRGGRPAPAPTLPQPAEVAAAETQAKATSTIAQATQLDRASAAVAGGAPPPPPKPPPGPPPPPSMQNGQLTQKTVDDMTQFIGSAPEGSRSQMMQEAHGKLAEWIQQNGRFVGPDGKMYTADTPEKAQSIAEKIINDGVGRQAKMQEDQQKQQEQALKDQEKAAADEQKEAEKAQKDAEKAAATKNENGLTPEEQIAARVKTLVESNPGHKDPTSMIQRVLRVSPERATQLLGQYQQGQIATVGSKTEPVVEEGRKTIDAQMNALSQGNVNVVMIPDGSKYRPRIPEGMKVISVKGDVPGAGFYVYDPKTMRAATIRDAAKAGTHGDLLGHIQPKEELAQADQHSVVQAKTADGTVIQDSVVEDTPEMIQAQAEVLQERHPDAEIHVKTPEEVIEERQAEAEKEANNAIQEPSAEAVGEQPGGTRSPGERGSEGVERGDQGEELTGKGKSEAEANDAGLGEPEVTSESTKEYLDRLADNPPEVEEFEGQHAFLAERKARNTRLAEARTRFEKPYDRDLYDALHGVQDATKRWDEMRTRGATDEQIHAQVKREFGSYTGSSGGGEDGSTGYEVRNDQFFHDFIGKSGKRKPTLQGPALVKEVRRLLDIPQPGQQPAPNTARESYSTGPKTIERTETEMKGYRSLPEVREEHGWLRYDHNYGSTLIHPTENKVISFTSRDAKSGTDVLRSKTEATAWAQDHPITRPQSEPGELVVKPIFEPNSTTGGQPNAEVKEPGTGDVAKPSPAPKVDQPITNTTLAKGQEVGFKDRSGKLRTGKIAHTNASITRLKSEGKEYTVTTKSLSTTSKQEPAEPKYEFGSTQVNLPTDSEAHVAIEDARANISDADLMGKGKDIGDNHVTVRYGIQDAKVDGIREYLKKQAPFEARLGTIDSFPPSTYSEGAAILKAQVESPELHRLNTEIEKAGNFKKSDFKEYKPHVTIAYVKPEVVDKYVGDDAAQGKTFKVDSIAISNQDGQLEHVKLEGKPSNEVEKQAAKPGTLRTYSAVVKDYAGAPKSETKTVQAENRRHAETLLAEQNPGKYIEAPDRVEEDNNPIVTGSEPAAEETPIAQFDAAIENTGADVEEGKMSPAFAKKAASAKKIVPPEFFRHQGSKNKFEFQKDYFKAALNEAKGEMFEKLDVNGGGQVAWDHFVKHGGFEKRAGAKGDPWWLYIHVPGDGHFLVNYTPKAVDLALKGADKGFAKPGKATELKGPSTPRAPKEFDNDKYIAQLEKQLQDDQTYYDRNRNTAVAQFANDQLTATKEALAEAKKLKKGEAPEGTEYLNGALGIAPGVMKAVRDTPLAEAIRDEAERIEVSRDLHNQLYDMRSQDNAAVLRVVQLLKSMPGTARDQEAIYHHMEDPDLPLTELQQEILDDYLTPMIYQAEQDFQVVTEGGVPIENYVHRQVRDRNGMIDKILERVRDGKVANGIPSGRLNKSAPAAKHRTMMAIVDPATGKRQVVSIKGKEVSRWKDGQPVPMGEIKAPEKGVKEFYDKHVIDALEKLAVDLGIKHERETNRSEGLGGQRLGVSFQGQNHIKTLAGTPEQVILHEIGHQLDERFGMQDLFVDNPETKAELRKLADLRHEGIETSANFKRYVRKGSEKMAVMFEAYLHAPERFKKVAPKTFKKFKDFLASHPETKPILDIKPSMVLSGRTVGAQEKEPDEFIDKNGKKWKIEQATTKVIEAATPVRYYHNAAASAAVNFIAMDKARRAFEFLEDFKNSPEFAEYSHALDSPGSIPKGWKATQLPHFRGYFFEPHIAEVLDTYAAAASHDPGVLEKVGNFLRTSIFFNPLIHIPNLLNHWVVEKGVSGFANPLAYPRMTRAGMKAINAVIHQNEDFLAALDVGAPLQSQQFETRQFADLFFKKMQDEIGDPENGKLKEMASALGMAPARLVKAIYAFSSKATWYTNDIAFLQSAYEKVERGMDLKEALTETGKHIPEYRYMTRIFDNRALGQLMSNPAITMFGAYHYGALKSYGQMMKSLTGFNWTDAGTKNAQGEPTNSAGRTEGEEKLHGLDTLAMVGLITFVVYPLIDQMMKIFTGDKRAQMRRAGASTFVYNMTMLAKGEKTPSEVAESVATPAVPLKLAAELTFNRDLRTGQRIYDVHAKGKDLAEQVGRRLTASVAPVGQGLDVAEGKTDWRKLMYSMVGVSFPLHGAQKIASQISAENLASLPPRSGAEVAHAIRRSRALHDAWAGNKRGFEELMKSQDYTAKEKAKLRKDLLTPPLVYSVKHLPYVDALKVYKAATEDEKRLLRPTMTMKLHNLLKEHKDVPKDDTFTTK